MSAMMAQPATVRKAVYAIVLYLMKRDGSLHERTVAHYKLYDLAPAIADMNKRAMQFAYKNRTGLWNNVDPETYRFNIDPHASPEKIGATWIECFKALQFVTYQCGEPPVDESVLFAALAELENKIACTLVEQTPEYKRAPWG